MVQRHVHIWNPPVRGAEKDRVGHGLCHERERNYGREREYERKHGSIDVNDARICALARNGAHPPLLHSSPNIITQFSCYNKLLLTIIFTPSSLLHPYYNSCTTLSNSQTTSQAIFRNSISPLFGNACERDIGGHRRHSYYYYYYHYYYYYQCSVIITIVSTLY